MYSTMRKELDPKIELQEILHKQIYDALQGDTLMEIRKIGMSESRDVYIRSEFEGNYLKVEKTIVPDIYNLCQDVLKTLNFKEPVDFYIAGNSEINAYSIASEVEGKPHIITIQSALFTLMNQDELKFVLGHEVGHLINHDSALKALIHFVYPKSLDADYDHEDMPDYLANRITLYDQIAELGADRYGFMACNNLDACVRTFYKLGSGLDISNMNISIDALIAENKKRLDFFLKEGGISDDDHPVNAIRIQALYLFASAKTPKELRSGMKELIDVLWSLEPMESDLAFFYATAGLIVASADGRIVLEEKEKIIERLGQYEFFPQAVLTKIENANITELFSQSVSRLVANVPSVRPKLLNYFIEIACADRKIADEELSLIFDFGQKLEFSPREISMAIAEQIRKNYVPKVM